MTPPAVLVSFGYPRLDRRHVWGWCTECGAPSVVTRAKGSGQRPACRITPGCDGRHVPQGEKP